MTTPRTRHQQAKRLPPWRQGALFTSVLPDVPCAPLSRPDSRTDWTPSWLWYKEDCQLLEVPRKQQLKLLDFKLSIAHHLLTEETSDDESEDEPPESALV